MGLPPEECPKTARPYLSFTTSTSSTTTPQPTLQYYNLPVSGAICPANPCICGSLFVPKGSMHGNQGSSISLANQTFSLVHPSDVYIEKEQKLITTSTKLVYNGQLSTNNITINFGRTVNLVGVVNLLVKIRETQKVIGQTVIGSFNESVPVSFFVINLIDTFNLSNLTLQLEISSLCQNNKQVCCDRLPSSIEFSNTVTSIVCTTTTTTTTLPPFCSDFNLPDSFYITVIGYEALSGQQQISLVTRNGRTWSTSGLFPCGASYILSMTCDSANSRFVYDGSVNCCEELTKTIISPTSYPLIYPNAITPKIVSYTDCYCINCTTTTTTTTTTTDFPTTPPPPPPIPCKETESLVINGYAFYRTTRSSVNIPGIGSLMSKCAGGHVCNRTDFLPQLITPTQTIDAQPISLNNAGLNDKNVSATFSFDIPDSSILKDGASIRLKCLSPNGCHTGVTWIVLTTEKDGTTSLLFNSCVVPNQLEALVFECDNCCDWDGSNYIGFACDDKTYNLPFYKIGSNVFEANGFLECGDNVRAIYQCTKDADYDGPSSCNEKWEVLLFSVPCAVNPRLTGNILQPCECNKPPIYEWVADDLSNCQCCGDCELGDCTSGIYVAGKDGSVCSSFYSNDLYKTSHLFFTSKSQNQLVVRGLGLTGFLANNDADLENYVSYGGENINIKTDNKPKSAIIRTNSLNCVTISSAGTRNSGYGQDWSHPVGSDTIVGFGAYTLTISDIDPSGEYEVHIRLGCTTTVGEGSSFPSCPATSGTYFYVMGDRDIAPTLNSIALSEYPGSYLQGGQTIESNVVSLTNPYAKWSMEGGFQNGGFARDCVAWLVEGWIVKREDVIGSKCRLKPNITASIGGGAILETQLIESVESFLDDNGNSLPYWSLKNINVLNGGTGYSDCQNVSINIENGTISEFDPAQFCNGTILAKAFVDTTFPTNYGITISGLINIPPYYDTNGNLVTTETVQRNGGANIQPSWVFSNTFSDPQLSPSRCGSNNNPGRKVYNLNEFIILNGGSGYQINDRIHISFPSGDGSYPFGKYYDFLYQGDYRVTSVNGNGSITQIQNLSNDPARYLGSFTSSIGQVMLETSGTTSYGAGCIDRTAPMGHFYKLEQNCSSGIAGIYPTFSVSVNGGGSGASLTAKTVRNGSLKSFSISDVSVNSGGNGYVDGQELTFTSNISLLMNVEAKGIAYVGSSAPQNPDISIYAADSNANGAILEPVFVFDSLFNDEYQYLRPYNPCNFVAQRKVYRVSHINILNGGSGYNVGDSIVINFLSNNDGNAVNGNPPGYSIDAVDENGSITSIDLSYNNYYVYGSLTDSIQQVVIYDDNDCNKPIGNYTIL